MTGSVQLALMLGPLAFYLYVLALWQSARTPRVVSGPLDFLMLVVGLSGLMVFGPIGNLLVVRLSPFGKPNPWAWLALGASFGLLVLPWLPRSFRRLVIYNVDADRLDEVWAEVLATLPGSFLRTVRGFEDPVHRRGLTIDSSPRLRSVVVEAYGHDPETLIQAVGGRLRGRLRRPSGRPAAVAWLLLGLCMGLIAPILVVLLTRPRAREVLRVLLERLQGG